MNEQKQPEALRLADAIEGFFPDDHYKKAAAELRRLHAENEKLRAGLGQPVAWIHTDPNNARVRILDWNPDGRGFRGHWIKTPLHVGTPQRVGRGVREPQPKDEPTPGEVR